MSDDFPNRQTIRLNGYDYSGNGYYFITICTQNMENMFGYIVGAIHESPEIMKKPPIMVLNTYGRIIKSIWESLPKRFPVQLDVFQMMPNHIHFIIIVTRAHNNFTDRAHRDAPLQNKRSLLSQIIGYFKMNASKSIHNVGAIHESPDSLKKTPIHVFQRNFFEHIIRSEREYKQIVYYIGNNPQNWETDKNYHV